LTKAATIRTHRRRATTVARSAVSPPSLTRVAYRPAAEAVCGSSACRVPIILFIGIAY